MSNAGFFDDLLDEPGRRRRGSTQLELDVSALVAQAVAVLEAGATPAPRSHTCLRCEKDADKLRAQGEPLLPIREATSWVFNGRRYWAAMCRPCTDLEWSELWQAKYDRANEKNNHGEMRRLVTLAKAREQAGYRLFVGIPTEALAGAPR